MEFKLDEWQVDAAITASQKGLMSPAGISFVAVGKRGRAAMEKGAKPGHVVGIVGERSLEMILGIVAILKVGGIYLPIDADYPEERKQYMLKDSNAGILVSKVSEGIEVIAFDEVNGKREHLPTHLDSTCPAYIMYTLFVYLATIPRL